MIQESEIVRVGKFFKPHGLKGEIVSEFDIDIFTDDNCNYLICNMEGIFVPFFISSFRTKNGVNVIIALEDIDNEEKAKRFTGLDIYVPKEWIKNSEEDNINSWNYFIDFEVIDEVHGKLGKIVEIDDNTINTLFVIEDDEKEYLIPAVEEFIVEIDSEKKILYLNTPEGLIE